MGIGTSLGAFYPDQFMFQSGQQKQYETKDKGVKKPSEVETDKELDEHEQAPLGMGIPVGMKELPTFGFPEAYDRLTGRDGKPRYKLWPERILESGQNLAGDVLSGAEPTWDMDPVTGEWHTSAKVIERAQDMSAFALGGAVPHKLRQKPVEMQLPDGTVVEVPMPPERSMYEKSQTLDTLDSARRSIREQNRAASEAPQTLGETNPYAETAGQFIDDYFNAVRRSERVSREMGHSQEPTANPVGRSTADETERALEAIRAALEDVQPVPARTPSQAAREIADQARSLREGLEATDPRRASIRTDAEVAAMNNRDFDAWYGNVSYQRLTPELIDRHSAILNRRHELGRLNGDEFIARFDTMNAGMEPMAARHVRRYEQLTGRRPEGYTVEEMHRPSRYGYEQVPFEDTAPTERIPVRRSTRNPEDDQALIDLFAQSDTQTGTKYPEKFQKRIDEAKVGEKINFFSKPAEERYGKFYFANEKGVGEVNASYFTDKKEIRIGSIGLIQDKKGNKINPLGPYSKKHGPQTFGKETRSIIKKLKETYPDAQWISGFRVTGARAKTGRGSAEAKMWIGKGPKPPEPTYGDDVFRAMDEDLGRLARDSDPE